MECSGSGHLRKTPHVDLLDSVLGDRPVNRSTGTLNSAPSILLSLVDETVLHNSTRQIQVCLTSINFRASLTGACTKTSHSEGFYSPIQDPSADNTRASEFTVKSAGMEYVFIFPQPQKNFDNIHQHNKKVISCALHT